MEITLLKGKLHKATVTGANLEYEGSCAIDTELLKASGILPYEQIDIYNISSGERLTTYAIEAEANSGTISIQGAAAHKANVGDLVIIAAFARMSEEEAINFKPKKILLDEKNKIKPFPKYGIFSDSKVNISRENIESGNIILSEVS